MNLDSVLAALSPQRALRALPRADRTVPPRWWGASEGMPGVVGAFFGVLCFLVSGAAVAQEEHATHPEQANNVVYLTLQQALRRGAERGPEVEEARAAGPALSEAVRRANPLFSQLPVLQAQFGPRFTGRTIAPDVVVSLSQPLPLTPVGPKQLQLARAEKLSAERELDLVQLDAAERAGHAWIEMAFSEELLALRKQAVAQAERNLHVVESQVRVGETDASALAQATSDVAEAKSLVLDAEGRHFLAASDLGYLTGLNSELHAEVGQALQQLDGMPSDSAPHNEEHPAVRSAEAAAEAWKASIAYAKVQQVPTFALGVQYQREGTGEQVITGLVSMPLPLWKPWTYQETRQRADYDRARARAHLARTELEHLIKRALHEMSHSKAQYQLIRERLLPAREEAVRLAQARFLAGEEDYLRLSWARRELLSAQERLAHALTEVHRASLHLKRCTGQLQEELR